MSSSNIKRKVKSAASKTVETVPINIPVVTKTVKDNTYERLLKFVNSIHSIDKSSLSSPSAYSLQISANRQQEILAGPCHANFLMIENLLGLAGGFRYHLENSNFNYAERVWDWITDLNKSPWRKLVKDIELIKKDSNTGLGWIITDTNSLNSVHPQFQKNFCILTRSITERPVTWKTWDHLVTKFGTDETEALYLASCFTLEEKTGVLRYAELRDGGHWPITDTYRNPNVPYNYTENISKQFLSSFDWKAFKTGEVEKEIRLVTPPTNGWFLKPVSNSRQYKGFDIYNLPKIQEKTKFSNIPKYNPEVVIEKFNEYLKEIGAK